MVFTKIDVFIPFMVGSSDSYSYVIVRRLIMKFTVIHKTNQLIKNNGSTPSLLYRIKRRTSFNFSVI